jgi:hypothetical protein
MRKGTAAVVVALLLTSVLKFSFAKAYLSGERIVISGDDNTLRSVAQDIGDPEIFTFDPEQNAALAHRNLLVQGTLLVGSEAAADESLPYSEVLEMNISRCGAVRIEVAASRGQVGELHLRRAKLTTIHETGDECSDPNQLVLRGKLLAHDSEISGNIECVIEPEATVELIRSTVSYTQDSAVTCDLREGQQIHIRNGAFIDNANYGLRLGRCPRPVEIRDSIFRGLAADVFNASDGELVLTDCDFRRVKFASLSGKVARKWSVIVQVPKPGGHVVARSAKGSPQQETVRGVCDENGVCELVLTEYVAFPPRAQQFVEGVNNVTPHVISVYDHDGETLLYKMENFHVFMKGQKVSFR